jgi:ribonuclease HI
MAGDPPASSNVWGYLAFQEALEEAKTSGLVNTESDVELFLQGFLAAWERMERAVQLGRRWPPIDW